MSEWISVEDHLPKSRTYVLIYRHADNWHDEDHQQGLNYRVAKFVRGLSKEKRERMSRGEIKDRVVGYGTKRSKVFFSADEQGNNERPYIWTEFGPHTYFGQEVTHWMPLPEPPRLD